MKPETKTEKIDDGGPAFPSEGEGFGNPHYHAPGMTLRDWFAGQVLAGLTTGAEGLSPAEAGPAAYRYADAMLAERSKP